MNHIKYICGTKEYLTDIKQLLKNEDLDTRNLTEDDFILALDVLNNKIIGCVRIHKLSDDSLELSSMTVLKEYRKNGIGKQMVKEILIKEDQRPIYLITFQETSTFYKKNGFKIVDSTFLPPILAKDFSRIIQLPFTQGKNVVAMLNDE